MRETSWSNLLGFSIGNYCSKPRKFTVWYTHSQFLQSYTAAWAEKTKKYSCFLKYNLTFRSFSLWPLNYSLRTCTVSSNIKKDEQSVSNQASSKFAVHCSFLLCLFYLNVFGKMKVFLEHERLLSGIFSTLLSVRRSPKTH